MRLQLVTNNTKRTHTHATNDTNSPRYNYKAAAAAATVYIRTNTHYYTSTNDYCHVTYAPTQAQNAIPEPTTIANNMPRTLDNFFLPFAVQMSTFTAPIQRDGELRQNFCVFFMYED
jgi:hypothetical protein